MTQIVRFVSAIGGATILDLSPGTGMVEIGDLSEAFPPPPIDRSVASNPVADGGSVPSAFYGLRTLKMPLVYTGGYVDPGLVGTVLRTNGAINPEAGSTSGYASTPGTTGATTNVAVVAGTTVGSPGPWVDGRRLDFVRQTWQTAGTGALAGSGVTYGTNAVSWAILAPGAAQIRARARSNIANRTARLSVSFWNSSNTQVGATVFSPTVAIGAAAADADFAELTWTGTAPAGTVRATVLVEAVAGSNHSIGETCDVTAILVENTNAGVSQTGYFSGDTRPGLSPWVPAWTGTAENSSSTLTWLSSAEARRRAIATLMRMLSQERAWLEVRPDGVSESRWFQTYRCADSDLTARLASPTWAELTVPILADPFAYGPKASLGTLTFSQASNDFQRQIKASTIKGDVPAPLMISTDRVGNNAVLMDLYATAPGAVGDLRVYNDAPAPSATPPSGSAIASASSANTFGGAYNSWTAVSVGQSITLSGACVLQNAAGTAGPRPGLYRAFAIVYDQTIQTAVQERWRIDLSLRAAAGFWGASPNIGIGQSGYIVGVLGSGLWNIPNACDLGVIEVPFGGRPAAAGFDPEKSCLFATLDVTITEQAGPANNSLGFDGILVLPAYREFLAVQYAVASGDTRTIVADPVSSQVLVRAGTTNVPDQGFASMTGTPPMVSPTEDVVLYGVRMGLNPDTGDVGLTPNIDPTLTATFDYWPRYLTVL